VATDSDPAIASHKLQTGLLAIQKWLKTWRVKANGTKSTHITFTTRRETCAPVHINNFQLPQAEKVKHLGLHIDRKLTWRNHIFTKQKQLGITLIKMYWLLGRQSKLSTSSKLLAYKVVLNPFGPMVCNFGARPPPLTPISSKDSSQRLYFTHLGM
jgi:hypothetical protein